MGEIKNKHHLLFFIGILLFTSCIPTKKIEEGQYMLVKNKVVSDKKEIPTNDIIYIVRPTPNKKFLNLFFLKAGIYQSATPKDSTKDNKTKQWFRKNFGEPLVLLDSSLIEYSTSQILLYMKNKGYFESKVDYQIKTLRQKKAKITYQITSGNVCKIHKIQYRIKDKNLEKIIFKDTAQCLIKTHNNFDVDVFSKERSRITTLLNNQGYYHFTENYIIYRIDSNLTNYTIDVIIDISNPYYTINEETYEGIHRKYYVKNIEIFSTFINPNKKNNTVYYSEIIHKKDTNHYTIYYADKIDFKPKTLVYPLSFFPGDLYKANEIKRTYNRYDDMKNFSFIKITYQETEESKKNITADTGYVNCSVQLSKMERNSFFYDLLGKNIGKDFGVGVNLSYSNRNFFKSGEIFSITAMYANEFQRLASDNSEKKWRFRNFEIGGDIGLEFSRFLFPIKQQNIPKKYRAKTILNIGSNYQLQDNYSRFITSTGFRYEWSTSPQITHILSVLNINLVKIYPDSLFKYNIQRYSKRIQEKYKDHLLIGTNYQLIYSSYKGLPRQNFFLLRFNSESYGNLLYALFATIKANKNENKQYNFWGIPFASYVSTSIDLAYNIMIAKKSALVLHTDIGIGIPTTKNSITLPFEKSFYLGGSNSIRAWRIRTLGPGSYKDLASRLESTGDVKIEFNIEFRTPIYKYLHIAFFTDAGNVWILKKNADLPNGEFRWDKFYKDIAIGSGIGLRLDLSFFVLRLDAALQIYNPAEEKDMKWINKKVSLKDIVFNVGIGYPF